MSSTHNKVDMPSIIQADTDEAAALARLCPDLAGWPLSWRVEDSDVIIGQNIVEFLKPFLHELLRQQLADKTLRRHRDHLWLLGGEVIRRRHEDDKLFKLPIRAVFDYLLEEEGGPLIWPRITEPEQNSFDATCRKLYRFFNQGKVA